MTYFKDLQKRMRAEENACKESNLFSGLNVSAGTKDAGKLNINHDANVHYFLDKLSLALESDLSKFLHRAPTGTKISMSLREKVLLKLIKSLRQIDAGSTLGRAAEIEAELLRAAGNVSSVYLSSVSEYIKRCGVEGIKKETNGEFKVTYDDLYGIVAGNEMLKEYSYPLSLFPEQSADSLVGLFESVKGCRRCGVPFIPAKYYSDDAGNRSGVCRYHSEKPERIGGLRVYGCCQAPVGDNNGCCTFEWHVFKGYKRGDPLPRYEQLNNPMVGRTAVALDAEMFYTVGGYEVSRVTLIDFFTETTLLDVLVLPRCPPVLDYNTKWSGVSAELYEGGGELEVMEFEAMKGRLREFIGEETILIGHSLDNDLLVLEVKIKRFV